MFRHNPVPQYACPPLAGVKQLEVFMRKLVPLSMLAAAAFLLGGVAANAQQKDTPAKAQGAGAECSRMTDAKMRDDCVHKAREAKEKSDKDAKKGPVMMDDKAKGMKN